MMTRILTVLAVLWSAMAQAEPDMVSVQLMPGWRTDSGTHMTGLQIDLAEGWKTYWRAPGDGGIPPQINWDGSDNIQDVTLHWPRPGVLSSNGMISIGYHFDLILPIEITPVDPALPVNVSAALMIGVCQDICVPHSARLSGVLEATVSSPDTRIERAVNQRPDTAQEAGIGDVICAADPIRDGMRVTARIDAPNLGADEYVVIEHADQGVWVSESDVEREGRMISASADMVPPDAEPFEVLGEDLRITLIGANRAIDIQGCSG